MQLSETLARQRAAFDAELPASLAIRRDRLTRARTMLKEQATRFCDALSEDFGHRSRDQSMLTDIAGSTGPIDHALKRVGRWMRPEQREIEFPLGLLAARASVEVQPKSVVGVIAPWNFPGSW